jgi:hypothetical protein
MTHRTARTRFSDLWYFLRDFAPRSQRYNTSTYQSASITIVSIRRPHATSCDPTPYEASTRRPSRTTQGLADPLPKARGKCCVHACTFTVNTKPFVAWRGCVFHSDISCDDRRGCTRRVRVLLLILQASLRALHDLVWTCTVPGTGESYRAAARQGRGSPGSFPCT